MRSPLCQTLCGYLWLRQNATRWQPRSTVGPPVASSSINVCCALCLYWFVFVLSCYLICFRLYVSISKLISILSVSGKYRLNTLVIRRRDANGLFFTLVPAPVLRGSGLIIKYYHHHQQRWLCDVFIMSP